MILVDHASSIPDHQPRCCQRGGHISQLELQVLELPQRLTELLPDVQVLLALIEGVCGTSETATTDIHSAAIQGLHGDLEAISRSSNEVALWYPHILEHDG